MLTTSRKPKVDFGHYPMRIDFKVTKGFIFGCNDEALTLVCQAIICENVKAMDSQ